MTAATWGCCPAPRRPGELLTRGDVCQVHTDRAAAERCGVLPGGVVAVERRERSARGPAGHRRRLPRAADAARVGGLPRGDARAVYYGVLRAGASGDRRPETPSRRKVAWMTKRKPHIPKDLAATAFEEARGAYWDRLEA